MKTKNGTMRPGRIVHEKTSPAACAVLRIAVILVVIMIAAQARSGATGTPAGTVITNQAYIDYKSSNGIAHPRVFTNAVTITVSQVGGSNVVPATSSGIGTNNTTVSFLIQIANTGNGNDTFNFNYAVTGGWTPTSVAFYADTNGNGVYDAGVDLAISSPYHTASIAADSSYPIFMVVTIPSLALAPDASNSVIKLTATSQFDPAVSSFGTFTTTNEAAVITAVKNAAPAAPKPGDIVTYTITMTNSGTLNATLVSFSDAIPANMTYVPSSITFNGVPKTDVADGDQANFNVTTPNTVTVNVGTVNSGGGVSTVTFQASVNAGVPLNTTINNQANINYNSGVNGVLATSNVKSVTVASLLGISITQGTVSLIGDPGDKITQKFVVKNLSNTSDTINITFTSSTGWSDTIWVDANGDGIAGTGGDYVLTDSNADGKVDTGVLPQNGTIQLLAVATIPPGTPDATVDTLSITAISVMDPTVSTTKNFTTTVTSPVLNGTISQAPTGSLPPGTVVTYTITVNNIGTGMASDVAVTNAIPAHMTYVANSIKTGNSLGTLTVRTDANDGDGAFFDAVTPAVVAGADGSISVGPGGTFIVQFNASIN